MDNAAHNETNSRKACKPYDTPLKSDNQQKHGNLHMCRTVARKRLLNLKSPYRSGDYLSRLAIRHSGNTNRHGNGCSCETCGRAFENPIQLTNRSASPTEVYNACPFCFSKQEEILETTEGLNASSLKEPSESSERGDKSLKDSEQSACPYYVGYLKKRPKNSPIPESCLTCQKMIQCLL